MSDEFDDGIDWNSEISDGKESDTPIVETPIESDDIFSFDDLEKEVIKSTGTVLDDFLVSKGIKDAKINMINDKNEEEEVNFYNLTKEEQLEILSSFGEEASLTFSPEEETFLKQLKDNDMSLATYLEKYKEQILQEAQTPQDPVYEIDSYTDQELFLLDLKSRLEDLTDEELISELEKEMTNETLFKKKTDALRKEYKALEDQYKEAERVTAETQREEQFNTFADNMVNIAIKTPELYGIELEDEEKSSVLSYLLDLDEKGLSNFYKDLNTPERLYEAAWFLKYGKSAFSALREAYEGQIEKIKKDSQKRIVITK